jgi:hypothetical protein
VEEQPGTDTEVREDVGELEDGRTIRYFSWVGEQ